MPGTVLIIILAWTLVAVGLGLALGSYLARRDKWTDGADCRGASVVTYLRGRVNG